MKRAILTSLIAFIALSPLSADTALEKYCGKYQIWNRVLISVTQDNGNLVIDALNYPRFTLTQESDTVFTASDAPLEVKFKKDRNGAVHSVHIKMGRKTHTARRIVMGNWEGVIGSGPLKNRFLRVKVINYRHDGYTAVFLLDGERIEIPGQSSRGKVVFEGGTEKPKTVRVEGEIYNREFKGTLETAAGESGFTLSQVFFQSPTLGMKPPAGAIVLLPNNGRKTEQNQRLLKEEWHIQPHWQLQDDGAVRISGSNLLTQREFGDARIHLEFQTPFMPEDRGQARGNSGVYLQDRYEIQVLDSFGLEPKDNLCGGIYKFAVPIADACLPPLEWQTYDIAFRAPRFAADGEKIASARVTVKHNGMVIHDDVVLDMKRSNEAPTGPIRLQDHNLDRVGYRNMWVLPLDGEG